MCLDLTLQSSCFPGDLSFASLPLARRSELCLWEDILICLLRNFPARPKGFILSRHLSKDLMAEIQSFARTLQACEKVEDAGRKPTAVYAPKDVSCRLLSKFLSASSSNQDLHHLQILHAFALQDIVVQLSDMHRTALWQSVAHRSRPWPSMS